MGAPARRETGFECWMVQTAVMRLLRAGLGRECCGTHSDSVRSNRTNLFVVDGDAMRARGVVVLFVRARNTQPNAMTKRMTSNTVSTAIMAICPFAPAFFNTAFIFL